MNTLNGIISTIKVQTRNSLSRSMMKYLIFFDPIFTTLLLYFIYSQSNRYDSAYYIIVGSSISTIINHICFSSAGDMNRERYSGNLEVLMTSPLGMKKIILGKIFGNFMWSIFSIIITYTFATYVLGVTLEVKNPLMAAFSLLILGYSFFGITMVLVAIFLMSRMAGILMNVLATPIALLTGMYFPIEVLPKAVQVVSYALPVTWANKLIKTTFFISSDKVTQSMDLIVSIVLGTIYLILSIVLFDYIERKSKMNASFGGY